MLFNHILNKKLQLQEGEKKTNKQIRGREIRVVEALNLEQCWFYLGEE